MSKLENAAKILTNVFGLEMIQTGVVIEEGVPDKPIYCLRWDDDEGTVLHMARLEEVILFLVERVDEFLRREDEPKSGSSRIDSMD